MAIEEKNKSKVILIRRGAKTNYELLISHPHYRELQYWRKSCLHWGQSPPGQAKLWPPSFPSEVPEAGWSYCRCLPKHPLQINTLQRKTALCTITYTNNTTCNPRGLYGKAGSDQWPSSGARGYLDRELEEHQQHKHQQQYWSELWYMLYFSLYCLIRQFSI